MYILSKASDGNSGAGVPGGAKEVQAETPQDSESRKQAEKAEGDVSGRDRRLRQGPRKAIQSEDVPGD